MFELGMTQPHDGGARKGRRPATKAKPKKKSASSKKTTRKIYTGPMGGKYYMKNGQKVYM
jgi:hypothetical protein